MKQRESILIFLRTPKPEFLLTGVSDVDPEAFHVREIPANDIIHVTNAMRQTRQNASLLFSTYFPVKFCHRLLDREKSNPSTRGQSAEYLHASMCAYSRIFLKEKFVKMKIRLLTFMQVCRK